MMTLKEIKENLCYNDLRNPERTIDEETAIEIAENNADYLRSVWDLKNET